MTVLPPSLFATVLKCADRLPLNQADYRLLWSPGPVSFKETGYREEPPIMIRSSAVVLLLTVWCAHGYSQDKVLQKAIDQAIERGVANLKQLQQPDGSWVRVNPDAGLTALAGLALLECGVSKDDPVIQKAAQFVRKEVPEMSFNYAACSAIMFLDRLGNPLDTPLIEALAVRLLAPPGGGLGAWGYILPLLGDEGRLQQYVKLAEAKRITPRKKATRPSELPAEIQLMLRRLPPFDPNNAETTDNSNTQFSTLALWVSGRYGLPVENTLKAVDRRYRLTQYSNGGWGYRDEDPKPEDKDDYVFKPAMSCTGLIGMAVHYGTIKDPKKKPLQTDPAVQKALKLLERFVSRPRGLAEQIELPDGSNTYYALWTLERTAMLYGLKKIGDHDWYIWGSEILVTNQLPTGAWEGAHPEGSDTCFALLFLKRSNIAPDLTRILMQGIAKDSASPSSLQKGPSGDNSARKNSAAESDSSIAQARTEAVRLSTALLDAPAAELDAILEKFRGGKGAPFTQTLAATIPQLRADAQAKARKTLAERLSSSSAAEIRKQMRTLDAEIRRAAAGACAISKTKELVPDLIDLLADAEAGVVDAAHQALRAITSQDFGPAAGASREEREAAIRAWRDWWKKQ